MEQTRWTLYFSKKCIAQQPKMFSAQGCRLIDKQAIYGGHARVRVSQERLPRRPEHFAGTALPSGGRVQGGALMKRELAGWLLAGAACSLPRTPFGRRQTELPLAGPAGRFPRIEGASRPLRF